MSKNGLATFVLLALMVIWTLLAWGTSGVLNWLPQLADMAQNGTTQLAPQLREGVLMLIPQAVLDAWLPWLLELWRWLMASFPMLISLLGYAVWFIWGLGMIVLVVLTVAARKLLIENPQR
jgi:hypothetical protein